MSEYKVGDKFLIEIETICGEIVEVDGKTFDDVLLYKIKGFNSLVFDKNGLDKLQKYDKYAENLEKNHEVLKIFEKKYNKGLQDAWELSKRIASKSFTFKNAKECFGIDINGKSGAEITKEIYELSYQEALAKLEAYEKEKAEIKVGDVVTISPISGGKYDAIVVRVKVQGYIDAIYSDGITINNVPPVLCKKTGKHIDIQSILKQISEE